MICGDFSQRQFGAHHLLFVLTLAVAMGVAHFFARRLTAPLETLRQGVRQVAAGDLSQRVEITSGDEIEELAGDFNLMAEGLQRRAAEQLAVLRLSQDFLGTLDRQRIMDRAAGAVAEALRTDYTAVLLPDPANGTLVLQAERGWGREMIGHLAFELQEIEKNVIVRGTRFPACNLYGI